MADDGDDDYSIAASPTKLSGHSSMRQQRRNRHNNVPTSLSTRSRGSCRSLKQQVEIEDWDLHEHRLYEADRLDCLRAQQEPARVHLIPASQNFTALQSMLEQHDLDDIEQDKPEVDPTEEANIVQQILRDFCASPTYVEDDDDQLLEYYSPRFRFRGQKIKTFEKRRLKITAPAITSDEDDCLSCSSSELSVQEDYNTQVPTRTNCDFDVNSSQKICENLLNLSAFFNTQGKATKSINLPDMTKELINSTVLEAKDFEDEDATGILEEMGYFIGDTEQCKYLDDDCDSKIIGDAEFSLFRDETTGKVEKLQDANLYENKRTNSKETQLEAKDASEIELLEEIALSEWQPIGIENSNKEERHGIDCKEEMEMDMLAFYEWQPVEPIDTPMDIQEAAPMKGANYSNENSNSKLVEAVHPSDHSTTIQFHTASNKVMKLTEEMKRKAAMLMSDLEIVVEDPAENENKEKHGQQTASKREDVATDSELLAGIPFSEWQPMEIPDSKETKDELDASNQLDMIPFSEWQPLDIPDTELNSIEDRQQRETNNSEVSNAQGQPNCKQYEISENIQFRTASNKVLTLSKEMKQKAAMLMADLEAVNANPHETREDSLNEIQQETTAGCSQTIQEIANNNLHAESENPVEFRTASNKVLQLTNEMRQKAAMLMADLEAVNTNVPLETEDSSNNIELKQSTTRTKAPCSQIIRDTVDENAQPNISKCIQFHTASNKVLKLTEEMKQKAAMLMADLEVNPAEGTKEWLYEGCISKSKTVASQQTLKEAEVPKLTIETIDGIYPLDIEAKQGSCLNTAFPLEHNLHVQNKSDLIYETPKCATELQSSLSQLSERSPLDRETKSSIITRRNLLSLNKRRKLKRNSESCDVDAGHTPIRRFASMAAATSTPMPSHREINMKENNENPQPSVRERSCSQDSPRLERKRMRKRKSEDALSPIYAPTHKTRRLGLSRIRNKSTHEI